MIFLALLSLLFIFVNFSFLCLYYNIDYVYSATYFSASDKTDIDISVAAVILYSFLHNIQKK